MISQFRNFPTSCHSITHIMYKLSNLWRKNSILVCNNSRGNTVDGYRKIIQLQKKDQILIWNYQFLFQSCMKGSIIGAAYFLGVIISGSGLTNLHQMKPFAQAPNQMHIIGEANCFSRQNSHQKFLQEFRSQQEKFIFICRKRCN